MWKLRAVFSVSHIPYSDCKQLLLSGGRIFWRVPDWSAMEGPSNRRKIRDVSKSERDKKTSETLYGNPWRWLGINVFFIITSELLVASHYYIGCWQLEVTVLFALLWYFDKIHVLSSRPNYIKSKCRRFTYIDVSLVPPCLEVIYYMLLIQISIPSGFGTYDMPWSCSFWERVYQYRVSYENRKDLLQNDQIWFDDMRYLFHFTG